MEVPLKLELRINLFHDKIQVFNLLMDDILSMDLFINKFKNKLVPTDSNLLIPNNHLYLPIT